jgi:hypothetical protein
LYNEVNDIAHRHAEAIHGGRGVRALFRDESLRDVSVLLNKIRYLEDEISRLTALKTPAPQDDGDGDEPTGCYCPAVHMPPCGYCSNPANFSED